MGLISDMTGMCCVFNCSHSNTPNKIPIVQEISITPSSGTAAHQLREVIIRIPQNSLEIHATYRHLLTKAKLSLELP